MIYGATGYTGALIAREAARRKMTPILAGRNALALEALGKDLGLQTRVVLLDDPEALIAGLSGVALVLNCAGPFSHTAEQMMRACIAKRVHYLDITGEIPVLERAHALDAEARDAGIVLCSGVAFDVVPTDCVAAMLADALPSATHLALGFDGSRTVSPGTAKSMVENIATGGKIRRNGKIVTVPYGYGVRDVDFGNGSTTAMTVPWGDVATAFYTTGIPNIAVYARVTRTQALALRIFSTVRFLAGSKTLARLLTKRIESRVHGPSGEERASGETLVWGEARDAQMRVKYVRLRTAHPYALSVTAALGIVRRLLEGPAPAGSTTPSRLMGSSYVLDLPGTTLAP